MFPAEIMALQAHVPGATLRLPTRDEIWDLAERSCGRILTPATAHFMKSWATLPHGDFERNMVATHLGARRAFPTGDWDLMFALFPDDSSGAQGMIGLHHRTPGHLHTGSWLLPEARGQGWGTAMRSAVISLAFDYLGAREMESTVVVGNDPAAAVAMRLGYEDAGERDDPVGRVRVFRLAPERRRSAAPVRWHGAEAAARVLPGR